MPARVESIRKRSSVILRADKLSTTTSTLCSYGLRRSFIIARVPESFFEET